MEFLFTLALVLTSCVKTDAFAFDFPEKLDYENHPCRRDCLDPRFSAMVCEYNFTVEHYQTLSRACYNCPHNISDCYRPHCITGDGSRRAIKVVNRMMPGPAIHVCQGDTIVVNVYNQLMDFEGTSIHWHGILQQGTPHMDGVAMLTQCPIPVHSVFQYRFQADSTGTHFWHAHAGMQRGDGVHGALIVRDTRKTEVMSYYDEDLPEHTIIIQDWLDQSTAGKFVLHHHAMGENTPASILINGRATTFGQDSDGGSMDHGGGHNMGSMGTMEETDPSMEEMDHDMMGDGTGDRRAGMGDMLDGMQGDSDHGMMDSMADNSDDGKVFVPHSVFRVRRGNRYRLRLISNGVVNCPLQVSVQGHNLTIIASDGRDLFPVEVESLIVYAGERYDVVLKADQLIGNYWMHVVGTGDCVTSRTSQTAIIRYESAMHMKPSTRDSYDDGIRTGLVGNPLEFKKDTVTVAQMSSYQRPDDVFSGHNVRKFYLLLGYNEVGNHRYLDQVHYPLHAMYEMHKGMHANHLYALQINRITFTPPDTPALTQYGDMDENVFCNETSVPRDCTKEFCECVHRLKVSLGDVVELVMIADGKHGMGNHPMHLHGYSFYVMGMEKLNTTIDRPTIEKLDRKGRLRRNFIDPIQKDTVVVPDGGYTIVRFKADNPGFWLFHCHVEFHLHLGLSMVVQVGETHEMKKAPANFPRCGSWKFTGEYSDSFNGCAQKNTNTASTLEVWKFGTIVFSLTIFSLFREKQNL